MPFIVGEIAARIGGDTRGFDRALGQVFRKGAQVEKLGRNMTRYLTLPFLGASAAVFKFGSDFETELSKIEGLVGISREQINAWKGDLQDMAGEVGKGPEELAQGLFFVTSAGFRGAEALDVLDKAARASAAGLGETKTVADLVTSAINAYGIENLDAAQATDVLVAAVREGKAEAPELAASMGQVLPIASELGVTFDQVGAAVAAMTRTGTDASTASIQLRQILASLLKPTSQAESAMAEMGTSSAQLRKTLREDGLVSVLGFLRKQMDENEQAMAQVFPNIRALSGALDIMGGNAAENVQIFERMTDTTGSLEKAFDAADRTGRQGLNKLLSELKSTATVLYQDGIQLLLGGFDGLREKIETFRNTWNGMSDEIKSRIFTIVGLLAAGGPLLIAVGKVTQGVVRLAGGFQKLIVLAPKLAKAVRGLTAVMIANPYLAVGAAIAGIAVASWQANEAIEAFKKSVSDMLSGGAESWQEVNEMIVKVSERMDELKKGAAIAGVDPRQNKEFVLLEQQLERLIDLRNELTIRELEGIVEEKEAEKVKKLNETVNDVNDAVISFNASINAASTESFGDGLQIVSDKAKQLEIDVNNLKKATSNISTEGFTSLEIAIGKADEKLGIVKNNMVSFGEALQATATDAVTSFAETLGNAFSGDAGAEGFFNNILLVVNDFANQFGKLLVGAGIAALAFEQLLANPIAAIAAGTALIAATTAVRNHLKEGIEARATGGPVNSGQTYLVGERGPELFSPNTSGMIIPNDRLAGASGGGSAGFERALSRHMQKLGPEEIWAMSKRGQFSY